VLASPLDPAGSLRVHVVANGVRRVLGDRARRPLTTACVASGVAALGAVFPHAVRSRFTSCAASSRVSSRSTRSNAPVSRGEARRAMAVARAATVRSRCRVSRLRSIARSASSRAPWRSRRRRTTGRSRCSHLPSILPGAFAFTSSRTARDVCSATVLGGLARLRAVASGVATLGAVFRMSFSSRFTSCAASSRVSSRSTRSNTPASRGEARCAMAVARAATARTPWRVSRLRSIARSASSRAPWRPARQRTTGGRGARISPRSCREHSRSRRRERRATCARRPCSAASHDCVHCIRRMQVP
jgi:hypothetical protein